MNAESEFVYLLPQLRAKGLFPLRLHDFPHIPGHPFYPKIYPTLLLFPTGIPVVIASLGLSNLRSSFLTTRLGWLLSILALNGGS